MSGAGATHAIAVLVSGGGRSLENLARAIAEGELDCRIALVLSSKTNAFALERARTLGIESVVVDPERELDAQGFSERVYAECEARGVELIVLAGFLRMLVVPERWERRILNIHPSLLPAFGGKGFYGGRVHRAVLEAGARESGCTVHYVTNEYDAGPIVLQRRVEVLPDDGVESLAERVFAEERIALPEAVRRHFAAGERA